VRERVRRKYRVGKREGEGERGRGGKGSEEESEMKA